MTLSPIFRKETLNESRKARSFLLRIAYVTLVFGLILLIYIPEAGGMEASRMAARLEQLARTLYQFTAYGQIGIAMLLTPILVTGSFMSEKKSGTLGLMSMTMLRDREVILGKVLSQYMLMLLLILAGIPMLTVIKLFTFVDLQLVLGNFVCALSTMIIAGGMGAFYGLTSRGIVQAIGWTWLVMIIYFIGTGVAGQMSRIFFGQQADVISPWVTFVLCPPGGQVSIYANTTMSEPDQIGVLSFVIVCILQLLVAMLVSWRFLTWAEAQYRWWSLGLSPKAQDWAVTRPSRRRVDATNTARSGDDRFRHIRGLADPFELREQAERRQARLQRMRVITIGSIVAVEGLALLIALGQGGGSVKFHRAIVGLQFLIMAAILAVQGGAAIAQEKENRTIGVLLTTPLTTVQILWGKVGSTVSLMWIPAGVVFGHCVLFAMAGVLHPASPLIVITVLVLYLGWFLFMSLAASAKAARPNKAIFWIAGMILILTMGTWMFGELFAIVSRPLGDAIMAINPINLLVQGIQPANVTAAQWKPFPFWLVGLGVGLFGFYGVGMLLYKRFQPWVREHV